VGFDIADTNIPVHKYNYGNNKNLKHKLCNGSLICLVSKATVLAYCQVDLSEGTHLYLHRNTQVKHKTNKMLL
jgi:hypothetical protein